MMGYLVGVLTYEYPWEKKYRCRAYDRQIKIMKKGYIILARKYRPQTFEEVVGQEHITRTLQNGLKKGKIGHSYLFSGPRGVGKTSVARILAKALNCEKGVTPEPCNKCSLCKEITAGKSMDVLEIDGASNRRIDEIRNLREGIGYAPVKARYKVYIIDEVHMLTTEAFNALLKTLEEPPPHVVFIFATTDPQKVPPTILSRCQRFDFRKLTTGEIYKKLSEIADLENISITPDSLKAISLRADGALRDAESMLDQLISYSEGEITIQDVKEVFGFIDKEFYINLITGILKKNDRKIISTIESVFEKGYNIKEFVYGIIDFIRNLVFYRLEVPNPSLVEEEPEMKELAHKADEDTLVAMLNLASEMERTLRAIPYSRAALELYLLKMARIPYIKKVAELISNLEETPATQITTPKIQENVSPSPISEDAAIWEKIRNTIVKERGRAYISSVVNRISFQSYDKKENILYLFLPEKIPVSEEQKIFIEEKSREIFPNVKVKLLEKTKRVEKKRDKNLMENPVVQKTIKLFGMEDAE